MKKQSGGGKVRIGVLTGTFQFGGAELQLIQLLRRMDRSRFEPVALTMGEAGELSGRLGEASVETIPLRIRKKRLGSSLLGAVKTLRSLDLDILYCVLPDSIIVGTVLGKLAGVAHVVGGVRGLGRTWRTRQIWGIRIAQVFADSFIVNSNAIKQMCISRQWIRPQKVEVIPNGLDLSLFPFTRDKEALIGIVGSLKPIKGQTQFVKAARILLSQGCNCRFMLVGDGPDRDMLCGLARDLKMEENVIFAGNVSNVFDYVGRFKILVSASAAEGMSNAIIEAFSSGTPVVASNVPSNNEIVTHLDTGLLYTYGDEKDLGEKLTLLLSDDELYRKVQVKARDRAEQWFDMSKMVSRTEDHFLRLVSRASR